MREWALYEQSDGDYTVFDEDNEKVIQDTSYYPSAPSLSKAYFIVDAVNFYLRHLEALKEQKQEDDE